MRLPDRARTRAPKTRAASLVVAFFVFMCAGSVATAEEFAVTWLRQCLGAVDAGFEHAAALESDERFQAETWLKAQEIKCFGSFQPICAQTEDPDLCSAAVQTNVASKVLELREELPAKLPADANEVDAELYTSSFRRLMGKLDTPYDCSRSPEVTAQTCATTDVLVKFHRLRMLERLVRDAEREK